MNEFQIAIMHIIRYVDEKFGVDKELMKDMGLIEDLVKKATPKTPYKPLGGRDHNGFPIDGVCESCGKVVKKYCSCSNNDCRQAIDWSKDE